VTFGSFDWFGSSSTYCKSALPKQIRQECGARAVMDNFLLAGTDSDDYLNPVFGGEVSL
jgi:hypothetical protein